MRSFAGGDARCAQVYYQWGGKGCMQQEVQEGVKIRVHDLAKQRNRSAESLWVNAPQKACEKKYESTCRGKSDTAELESFATIPDTCSQFKYISKRIVCRQWIIWYSKEIRICDLEKSEIRGRGEQRWRLETSFTTLRISQWVSWILLGSRKQLKRSLIFLRL